jgi:glycosyltransferase involved in cell wall biosynthesis
MDLYDDYPTLFTVNRNTFRTRFQPLWDLFVLIHKTITPDCIYLHLGEGVSKCEEQVLSHELTLDKHIRFVGNQTEVRKYQIASDIYLMTSRFEGIPLTTIEAMACRIPAILYDVPGLRDFNKKDENSILIPEDYKVLADKLIFIKNNKWKSTEIAENAMKFVNTTFDMKTNVKKIIDLYNTQS